MTKELADHIAAALDLDVAEMPICYACLSFVSWPLHDERRAEARRAARRVAPDLWDEGLEQPALDALRCAADAGVPDAKLALLDAQTNRGRSAIAPAIVFRLATQLAERSEGPLDFDATKGWAGVGWTRL